MNKFSGLKWSGALVGLSLAAGAAVGLQDAPKVWLTSDLIGMNVVSPEGDDLGEIEDVVVHPGGETAYAVLAFGGWLGMGEKLFAMPWSVLRSVERDTDKPDSKRSLVLPMDKAKLKQAPGFDKKNWPAMANADWSRDIDTFYEGSSNPNTRKAINASARNSRITWKVSDLRGCSVETPTGEELGDIKELAIDTNGRVSYVALDLDAFEGQDDRMIAVPWDSFEFSLGGKDGDEKRVTLASARTQLQQAPLFMTGKEHTDEMSDPAWIARVHKHFSVKPYWTETRTSIGAVGSGD
ncbi:MAG TPA: PRC-barrel domain-containing protein [Planctomycetota bacterium]|nr:PRC-barrel domain-containing protein [Planctomycetota bacterium]